MLGFITNFFQVYHILFHICPISSPSRFSSFLFILPVSFVYFSLLPLLFLPQSSFCVRVRFHEEQSCNKRGYNLPLQGGLRVPEGIAGWFIFWHTSLLSLTCFRLIYIPPPVCTGFPSPHTIARSVVICLLYDST